jgi:hypothetical protein
VARLNDDCDATAIPPGPYYTANQTAEVCGVSLRTLARWDTLDPRRGPRRWRLDGSVRYVAAEADDYAAKRRTFLAALAPEAGQ